MAGDLSQSERSPEVLVTDAIERTMIVRFGAARSEETTRQARKLALAALAELATEYRLERIT